MEVGDEMPKEIKVIVGIMILIAFLLVCFLFYLFGVGIAGSGNIPQWVASEIHYQDKVIVDKGFYKGTVGVVMKENYYDHKGQVRLWIESQRDIIDVYKRYLRKLEGGEQE